MSDTPKKRIHSIDLFKFLAVCGVIWIHAEPLRGFVEEHPDNTVALVLFHGILLMCRMAVPFFFVVSGYFLHAYLNAGRPFPLYLKRLLKIFAAWSLFYMLVPTYHYHSVVEHGWLRALYWGWIHAYNELILDPWRLFSVGGKYHLWYIWGLAWGASLMWIFHKTKKIAWALPVGAAVYAYGISQKCYSGLFPASLDFPYQHGPIIPLVFLALGYRVAGQNDPARNAWLWAVAGFMLMAAERFYLVTAQPQRVYYEFLIGAVPCALGLLKLTLKYPDLGKDSLLAGWGRLTLGVYVLHLFILELLFVARDFFPGPGWIVLLPALTLALTLTAVTFLSRHDRLRVLIT